MNSDKFLKTVRVYTENEYLFQKIKLELSGVADTRLCSVGDEETCDVVIVDADNPRFSKISGLQMKRGGGDISIPFSLGSLRKLIEEVKKPVIELIESEKSVRMGNKKIKLTELEFSLLSLIMSKKGNYVGREEILKSVWGTRADAGIINVYVHYLREKLECDGEKIILSSRNFGYKINERYVGGESDA